MLERLRKGRTAQEAEIPVAIDWDEFEPDEYDGSEDGDDSIHHKRLSHLIDSDLKLAHQQEHKNV